MKYWYTKRTAYMHYQYTVTDGHTIDVEVFRLSNGEPMSSYSYKDTELLVIILSSTLNYFKRNLFL